MNRLEWDKYFMILAKVAALRSGCNSRPTGAVIVKDKLVLSTGYNGSIAGTSQCTDEGDKYCHRRAVELNDEGEKKYLECRSIHAEQNAINQIAKRGGNSTDGAVIYCTLFPCIFCLKNIASVGIKKIFYEIKYNSSDSIRDQYWEDRVNEYDIKTSQITLSKEDHIKVKDVLFGITSHRRL